MDRIPPEVISYIFQFLDVSDRKEASRVCKNWYEASQDPALLRQSVFTYCEGSRFHPSGCHPQNLILKDSKIITDYSKSSLRNLCDNLQSLSIHDSGITVPTLISILKHCHNLEEIDIASCNSLFMTGKFLTNDDDINALKQSLKNVTSFNLSSVHHMSDATFGQVTSLSSNLVHLNLSGCRILFHMNSCSSENASLNNNTMFTYGSILQVIRSHASSFKSINLSNTGMNNNALEAIASIDGLELREVYLDSCKELSDLGIAKFSSKQPGVEILSVSKCVALTNQSVSAIVGNLKKLKSLNLSHCRQINDASIVKLREMKTLQYLDLSACYALSSQGLTRAICRGEHQRNLTYLDLNCCSEVHDGFVIELSKLVGGTLTHLDLGSCQGISDIGLHHINEHLTKLTFLRLSWIKDVTDYGLLGLMPDEKYLKHKHSEEGLCRCSRKKATASPLLGLALPELKPQKLTDEMVDEKLSTDHPFSISNLTRLKHLDLRCCSQVSDISVIRSLIFKELKELHLEMCRISDKSLVAIADNLPSIEVLYAGKCKAITDEGISYIARKMTRLKSLSICSNDNLTHKSMEYLATYATGLRSIDVSHCGYVTIESVDMLENTLPNLNQVQRRFVGGKVNK